MPNVNNNLGELDDLDDLDDYNNQEGENNNMADSTQYERKLAESFAIPERDNLVLGGPKACVIKIATQGTYNRGLLMMESSNNEYVNAAQTGVSSSDIIILADNLELEAGEYAEAVGYFAGEFNSGKIILSYETENDNHDELIAAIEPALRKKNIILR